VLDTNVFISGVFFTGPPYQILEAWRDGNVEIIIHINTKYGLKTIFGVFLPLLFNLHSAHQIQFLNNFQVVKA
jgi:hypothetical protein